MGKKTRDPEAGHPAKAGVGGGLPALAAKALPFLVYAFAALLIMLPLLGPGYYLALDMQFGPNSFSLNQFGDLYGTQASQYGNYLPIKLTMAAVSQALPIELVEKSPLFVVLLLCGAGIHYSLPKELGNSRYFAGLLYMLNPFVFVRFLAGHWSLLLSYALWPFAIRSFLDYLSNPKDSGAMVRTVLLTTAAAVSSHGLFMLLIAYLVIFLAQALSKRASGELLPSQIIRTLKLGALFVLLNLFWLVPTYILTRGMYNPSSPQDSLMQFGSQGHGMPLPLAVLTMHGFWRDGFVLTKDVFTLWYIPFVLIMLVVLAGSVSLLRSDRWLAVSLFVIGAAGFLLALGASSPIYQLFTVFGDGFPLYLIFRDTQKFVGLLCLSYAWFGAYGADALASSAGSFMRSGPARSIATAAALLLLVSLPIIYDYGFFGLLHQVGQTSYPDDWYKAEQIIGADPTPTNILVFPPHLYSWYPWVNDTQKTIGPPASQFFSKPVVSPSSVETQYVQSDVNDSREEYMDFLFNERQYINATAELLLPLDVRYIIVLKDDPDYIHYLYLFERKGGVKDIELLYSGPTLLLFRDDLVAGPFFSSKENGSGGFDTILQDAGNGMYSPNVTYERTGATSYQVTSSQYVYVVSTMSPPAAYSAGPQPLSSWHDLGSYWGFTAPAAFTDWVSGLTISLAILAWVVALWLMAGISKWRYQAIGILAVFAVAMFSIIDSGALSPSILRRHPPHLFRRRAPGPRIGRPPGIANIILMVICAGKGMKANILVILFRISGDVQPAFRSYGKRFRLQLCRRLRLWLFMHRGLAATRHALAPCPWDSRAAARATSSPLDSSGSLQDMHVVVVDTSPSGGIIFSGDSNSDGMIHFAGCGMNVNIYASRVRISIPDPDSVL